MIKNIFKGTDSTFIKEYFSKRKDSFFPDCKERKITDIDIKRVSPEWAEDNCLVRYKIVFEGNLQKIVRGTAEASSSKKNVWSLMEYLYTNSSKNLTIARPLEYMDEINMLFYEEAPGTPLASILQDGDINEKMKAVKGVALWLSWLHNLSPSNEKIPNAIFIGSSGYRRILSEIEDEMPELKNDLPAKSEVDFIDNIWILDNKIIHNDFYPGNSVIKDDTIFGIDFDRAGFGPPLADVAALSSFFDFSEKMRPLYKMSKNDSQKLKKVFLEEYCLSCELNLNETTERIYPFVIKSFLDQLHYYVALFIRGRKFMDKKTEESFLGTIKEILVEIKKLLTKDQ